MLLYTTFVLLVFLALFYRVALVWNYLPYNAQSIAVLQTGLTLSSDIYQTSKTPFIEHTGEAAFESYLALNIPYTPISEFFKIVNPTLGKNELLNRGEAHITVISPPEFDKVLKPAGVSIQEINEIAIHYRIQHSKFKVICLGHAQLPYNITGLQSSPQFMEVFMLIVKDSGKQLVALRKHIYDLYIKKGGQGALFDPKAYWPHITIGYNVRDLFVEDGVYKDINACIKKITVV
ncbi:hypothetical protein BB561_000799 [Smittium simulii]|uniref:Swiss Army Knife 2H phosphoesterase domain-containing protein n=1 Tax=Smittium simulii TaxID=133385 RepID=A0A2T9YXI0_9FUNG|nr:hypothetical protein BB561_000799 [Smittium simulii]